MADIAKIELTSPPPAEGIVDETIVIEGNVKLFDTVGAPPWVYARVQKKDWYKPDVIEETNHFRGFPAPVSGDFKINWTPQKTGIYDVTVIATPAPLSLPVVGVFPITGQTDVTKVTISELSAELEIQSSSFS